MKAPMAELVGGPFEGKRVQVRGRDFRALTAERRRGFVMHVYDWRLLATNGLLRWFGVYAGTPRG